jgi:hypothetical protein
MSSQGSNNQAKKHASILCISGNYLPTDHYTLYLTPLTTVYHSLGVPLRLGSSSYTPSVHTNPPHSTKKVVYVVSYHGLPTRTQQHSNQFDDLYSLL